MKRYSNLFFATIVLGVFNCIVSSCNGDEEDNNPPLVEEKHNADKETTTEKDDVNTTSEGDSIDAEKWKLLTFDQWPAGSSWSNFESRADLSAYAGKAIRLALVYKSTTNVEPTWEVGSISVKSGKVETEDNNPGAVIYYADLKSGQGGYTILDVTKPTDFDAVWTYNSKYGMVATGYDTSAKTRYAVESWLVSPAINLKSASGNLMLVVNHAVNYLSGNAHDGILDIYVSDSNIDTTTDDDNPEENGQDENTGFDESTVQERDKLIGEWYTTGHLHHNFCLHSDGTGWDQTINAYNSDMPKNYINWSYDETSKTLALTGNSFAYTVTLLTWDMLSAKWTTNKYGAMSGVWTKTPIWDEKFVTWVQGTWVSNGSEITISKGKFIEPNADSEFTGTFDEVNGCLKYNNLYVNGKPYECYIGVKSPDIIYLKSNQGYEVKYTRKKK